MEASLRWDYMLENGKCMPSVSVISLDGLETVTKMLASELLQKCLRALFFYWPWYEIYIFQCIDKILSVKFWGSLKFHTAKYHWHMLKDNTCISYRFQIWRGLRAHESYWNSPEVAWLYLDDLVQDCSNSIADALELLQHCTKPSIYKYLVTFFNFSIIPLLIYNSV